MIYECGFSDHSAQLNESCMSAPFPDIKPAVFTGDLLTNGPKRMWLLIISNNS